MQTTFKIYFSSWIGIRIIGENFHILWNILYSQGVYRSYNFYQQLPSLKFRINLYDIAFWLTKTAEDGLHIWIIITLKNLEEKLCIIGLQIPRGQECVYNRMKDKISEMSVYTYMCVCFMLLFFIMFVFKCP